MGRAGMDTAGPGKTQIKKYSALGRDRSAGNAGRRADRGQGGAEHGWRQWVVPAAFIVGSAALYVLLSLAPEGRGMPLADRRVARDGYGGGEKAYEVVVEGLEEEPVSLAVTVGAQIYTREEARTAFIQAMDQMEQRIRGENPSLMEVRTDLSLPARIQEQGIRLKWYVSDPEYMDAKGTICREVESERDLILSVQLTASVTDEESGRYDQNFEIPIRLLPKEKSLQEEQVDAFRAQLQDQDKKQQAQAWLELPSSFGGRALSYRMQKQKGNEAILLLGFLAAALWKVKGQSGEQDRKKKRERELLLDYADLLSKLMVLIGAGLTTRNAWERMVQDYEEAKRQGRQKTRAAYEEMSQTCYQMQSGVPEGEAYREFGRRCRLQPYLKLSSLLEQNRRAGTKNLRALLQAEMADALEQRKNLARRLGEEAGTRLLMPLFLMLGIIMVMIMVPAMMTMG